MSQLLPQPRVLLPNTPNATPRQVGELHLWASGDPLQAADLNANFLLLLSLVQQAAAQARTPDPGAIEAMAFSLELDQKIAVIERHVSDEQRRQTRFGYAPLATVGALKKQLDDIQGPLVAEARRLHAKVADEDRTQEMLAARLEVLESQPAPPTELQFQALLAAFDAARRETATMHRDVMRLREEVYRLRPVAQAHQQTQAQRRDQDEQRSRALAQLVRRVGLLEKPHTEAERAEQQTGAMRAELAAARQEVQAAADKAREELLRMHALLLERIETLEKQYGPEEGRPG